MYTILLSGGAGKRLWPLSCASRPKQYVRFLKDEQTGKPCSMSQRIWSQLGQAGLTEKCAVCAGRSQLKILREQLGSVNVAVEPEGRDTFPAAALSCAYLKSRMGARDDDVACIIPVDPYTDGSYFEALKQMPSVLAQSGAQIVLMGIKPTFPSENYGYFLPEHRAEGYLHVDRFFEKPSAARAEELIRNGALWNGGVFCLRLGTVFGLLSMMNLKSDYDSLFREYRKLPATSFDYAVLEKAKNIAAVPFCGMWKDIGTWKAVSEILDGPSLGTGLIDTSCRNVHVINETDIPVATLGVRDLMIVASRNGILVTGYDSDRQLKQLVSALPKRQETEGKSRQTVGL